MATRPDLCPLVHYSGGGVLDTQPLIIEFWAPWCPPCRQGFMKLNYIHEKYKSLVGIAAVCFDYEDMKAVENFICATKPVFPVFIDEEKTFSKKIFNIFNVTRVPYALLYKADKTLVWNGEPTLIEDELKKILPKRSRSLTDLELKD